MRSGSPPLTLTPRERDVIRGVVAGRTNRELGRELGLNEQSVKNVLSTVYLKCHVRNRLELALFAVRHHLGREQGSVGKSHGRERS
jgi:two-component system, NarL family, nitrate/nitrite response regulator NarL